MRTSDFRGFVTLPYSEDGFGIAVVSHKETRIPKDQWEKIKKRGIVLLSEDYVLLRSDIQRNCQVNTCKKIVGQFDELFLTIDKSLKLIPWN